MPDNRSNEITFYDCSIESLPDLLGLIAPPFREPKNPFRQLDYIYRHVKSLGCKTILLENHYIDRDYIEDYSLFYSKNYRDVANSCRRLHFFTLDQTALRKRFEIILQEGKSKGRSAYKREGAYLSDEAYLGFCIVKPLMGSPVGRTVLRTFGQDAGGNHKRDFSSIRGYKAHVLGVELKIRGLAFQQQDVGVSACATTALWSSLQQSTQFEEIRPATPAQITMLASQYILPFGRALPSEGLSVGQMCQAIQALGVSPNMFKVAKEPFEAARSYLHSVTLSGFAPVLVIQSLNKENVSHAVTVTGVKLDSSFGSTPSANPIVDRAGALKSIYIHDDRVGPYIRADIFEVNANIGLGLSIQYEGGYKAERWLLTHLLVPLHAKIRVTFTGLRRLATTVIIECAKEIERLVSPTSPKQFPGITYEVKIQRATDYFEELVFGGEGVTTAKMNEIFSAIPFSRYVGIIRMRSDVFGSFDLLIDTTSTMRNLNYLGVIFKGGSRTFTSHFSDWLVERCSCPSVIDS